MTNNSHTGLGFSRWISVVGGVVGVGVLAYQFAYPAYTDYQSQNKLAEVFVSTDVCRAEIEKVVQNTTAPELSTSLFGCDGGASAGIPISRYLRSIAIGPNGAITVTLDFRSLPELSPVTNTVTLVPLATAFNVLGTADVRRPIYAWRCGSLNDGTTLPAKYLPTECRV